MNKHRDKDYKEQITEDFVKNVLQVALKKINETEHFQKAKKIFENIQEQNLENIFKVNVLLDVLKKKVNYESKESFYRSFYSVVINRSSTFLVSISNVVYFNLFFIKLGEVIQINLLKKDDIVNNGEGIPIVSDREMAGLQYIGGYVIHNLHRKIKNLKKYDSQKN